mmetsp:Transcript_47772/g.133178  ORF Transcript_47772/g.133178 Transcript_47772/m.133178 type:complete len:232 (+) Transcript_47772:409-1104(+)
MSAASSCRARRSTLQRRWSPRCAQGTTPDSAPRFWHLTTRRRTISVNTPAPSVARSARATAASSSPTGTSSWRCTAVRPLTRRHRGSSWTARPTQERAWTIACRCPVRGGAACFRPRPLPRARRSANLGAKSSLPALTPVLATPRMVGLPPSTIEASVGALRDAGVGRTLRAIGCSGRMARCTRPPWSTSMDSTPMPGATCGPRSISTTSAGITAATAKTTIPRGINQRGR